MVGHKMWLTGAKGESSWFGVGSVFTDYRYWYIAWHRVTFWLGINVWVFQAGQ